MPVYDQYEVEPTSAYSGSYLDNAIFGTIFADKSTAKLGYTPLGQPNPITNRRIIASRFAGKQTTYPNINNMWIPNYIIDGYASGSWLGRIQKFSPHYSNEFYYDSYMPNPVDIYLQNGGTLIGTTYNDLANTYFPGVENILSGSSFGINPIPNPGATGGDVGMMLQFLDKAYPLAPPAGVDYLWAYRYPFQSEYKGIGKLSKFSSTLPKKYDISNDFSGGGYIPVSQSNQIAGIFRLKPLLFEFVFGYMNYPTKPYQYGSIGSPVSPHAIGTISTVDLYNSIFGFGKGPAAFNELLNAYNLYYAGSGPDYQGFWALSLYFFVFFGFFSTVKIRGYKYGIRRAEPEQQKIIYRGGRFGQFRDMLEGRVTTATLTEAQSNPYNGRSIPRTLFYPVEISFVSGTTIYNQSRDYVTATNPTYNPYDSGIYDIYYRSGQPFFDRENED